MVKSRYLFKFYYIGKPKYFGSQRQKKLLTIEKCLLNALITRSYIREVDTSGFEVASRTDRFVSARGAYFSSNIEKKPILMEINSALPKDIGIWALARVPTDFSSRYNANLRHYVYLVSPSLSNLENSNTFNFELMKKACTYLEGSHDFTNFSKNDNEHVKNIRDMQIAKISCKNGLLMFQFKSKGFLRQQIRRIVKKLLELGKGDIDYDAFLELFDASKPCSYQPADPRGLILWDITYNDTIEIKEDKKSKERMLLYFFRKEMNSSFQHQLFRMLHHNNLS